MEKISKIANPPPRIVYLDTMRFLAALWVFTTHFIAAYRKNLFVYWTTMPFSLFLEGVSGKLAVAVFCVVLGYLACENGQRNTGTFRYVIKRYIYFFSLELVLNTIYVVVTNAGFLSLAPQSMGIQQIIYSSVFLKDNIVGVFWCQRPLFIGSLLCFINGKYNLSWREVLVQSIVMIFIGQTWIGIALLGNLAERLLQKEEVNAVLKKWWIQLLLMIAVSILIKRPESNTTYLIDGICMMVVVLIFANSRWVRAILEHERLQNVNKHYLGVYLGHVMVFMSVGHWIFMDFTIWNHMPQFILAYMVILVLVVQMARPLEFMVNKLAKMFIFCLDWIFTRCKTLYMRLRIHHSN